jgi:DNA-binding GntR family transcriptional regulator
MDDEEGANLMQDVQPLAPSLTLAVRGAGALRDMIMNGVLHPGDRLNEVELSAALGISRAPLREAIRQLASQGLLTIVTHKGAFVPSYTAADLRDIYEVRIALEAHATRLFAEYGSADQLNELKRVLDQAAAAIKDSGSPVYPDDLDFHQTLIQLVGNPHLTDMATEVDQKLQLARSRSGHVPVRAREALAEHRQILHSLTKGDADGAADLMTWHLRRSLANVLSMSEREEAGAMAASGGPAPGGPELADPASGGPDED